MSLLSYGWEAAVYVQASRLKTAAPFSLERGYQLPVTRGFSLVAVDKARTLRETMQSKPRLIENLLQTNQTCSVLEPISRDKPPYNEGWLQNLIHFHPELVPASEIEACFENIVPIVREFPLSSRFVDNLYITPDGYPVLVEVKLWKNQEARREVVVQILEYAKDFSSITCEEINSKIRNHKDFNGKKWGTNPLYEIVTAYTDKTLDESIFVDRVSRNLREGRFLLLIVGDGIREEMAALANYLLLHSLRYAFGIIQIKLFNLPNGSVVAVPSVLAKTQTIERHVTIVTTQGGSAYAPQQSQPIVSEKIEKTSISLEEFYSFMAEKDPQNVVWVKELLDKLSDLPVDAEVGNKGETLMLKMTINGGERLQFIYLTTETASFWGVPEKERKVPAWRDISVTYLQRIAALVPNAEVHATDSSANIKYNGKTLRIEQLHGKTAEIANAIRQVVKDAEQFYLSQNE